MSIFICDKLCFITHRSFWNKMYLLFNIQVFFLRQRWGTKQIWSNRLSYWDSQLASAMQPIRLNSAKMCWLGYTYYLKRMAISVWCLALAYERRPNHLLKEILDIDLSQCVEYFLSNSSCYFDIICGCRSFWITTYLIFFMLWNSQASGCELFLRQHSFCVLQHSGKRLCFFQTSLFTRSFPIHPRCLSSF